MLFILQDTKQMANIILSIDKVGKIGDKEFVL